MKKAKKIIMFPPTRNNTLKYNTSYSVGKVLWNYRSERGSLHIGTSTSVDEAKIEASRYGYSK